MKKELRKGKVLVDWSQNDQHKTTIAVYSLRAREHPTVSTPVKWEEVEHMLKKKDATLLVFEAAEVLKRVEKMGDLFEPLLTLKQKLPKSAADVGASAPLVRRAKLAEVRRASRSRPGNSGPSRNHQETGKAEDEESPDFVRVDVVALARRQVLRQRASCPPIGPAGRRRYLVKI